MAQREVRPLLAALALALAAGTLAPGLAGIAPPAAASSLPPGEGPACAWRDACTAWAFPSEGVPDIPFDVLLPGRVLAAPDSEVVVVVGDGRDVEGVAALALAGIDSDSGRVLWRSAWSHPRVGPTRFADAVLSPDGSRVYVGASGGEETFSLVAFRVSDGERVWVASGDTGFVAPGVSNLAVSPDGSTVVAAGQGRVPGPDIHPKPLVGAYSASSGALLWSRGYDSSAFSGAALVPAFVDAGANLLFGLYVLEDGVTRASSSRAILVEASTGDVYWDRSLAGGHRTFLTHSLLASDGQSVLFVARENPTNGLQARAWRVAIGTGGTLWTVPIAVNGWLQNGDAALAPAGDVAYFAGSTFFDSITGLDGVLVALETVTGTELWRSPVTRPGEYRDVTETLIAVPSADRVFVVARASEPITYEPAILVTAFDARTGARVWQTRFDAPASNGVDERPRDIVIHGGAILAVGWSGRYESPEGEAVAMDAATGRIRWSLASAPAGPASLPDGALATSLDGSTGFLVSFFPGSALVEAVSALDGTPLWTARLDSLAGSDAHGVAVAGDRLLVAREGEAGLRVVALDAQSGRETWRAALAHPGTGGAGLVGVVGESSRFVVARDVSDAFGVHRPEVVAFDAATGAPAWSFDAAAREPGAPRALALGGARVFVSLAPVTEGSRALAVAIDAATGAEAWRAELAGVSADPDARGLVVSRDAGLLLASGASGASTGVVALDLDDGATAWTASVDGAASAPLAVVGGMAVVGTSKLGRGTLTTLELATGTTWRRLGFGTARVEAVQADATENRAFFVLADADGKPREIRVAHAWSSLGTATKISLPASARFAGLASALGGARILVALDAPPAGVRLVALPGGDPPAPVALARGGPGGAVGSTRLTWAEPSSDGGVPLGGYLVLRTSPTGEKAMLALPATSLALDDEALVPGTSYNYEIAAWNAIGRSPPVVLVARALALPQPPQAFVVTPRTFAISVEWDPPADDGGAPLLGYRVYRQTGAGAWRLIREFAPTYESVEDAGVELYKGYSYRVTAFTRAGEGPPTPVVCTAPGPLDAATETALALCRGRPPRAESA